MTLKKVKPTTKKVAAVKKPAVKKPTEKSTIVAAPKQTKAAVKKKVSAVAGKKAPAIKAPPKKTTSSITTRSTPRVTKKTSVTKAAPPKVESGLIQMAVTPTLEERYRMVETAAYFIAEQHGFHGRSDEHWAAAERAIAGKLGQ